VSIGAGRIAYVGGINQSNQTGGKYFFGLEEVRLTLLQEVCIQGRNQKRKEKDIKI
jgi:hypothetical protein